MTKKNEDFLKRLLATFRVEAEEHLRVIASGLLELEKTPESSKAGEALETVFREAHSLKGAARSVNLRDIESICQPMESAFSLLKQQELVVSPELCDLFQRTVDHISQLVSSTEAERAPSARAITRELIRQLEDICKVADQLISSEEPAQIIDEGRIEVAPASPGGVPVATHPLPEAEAFPAGTVRMPTAKLAPLLLQAEEMTLAKISAAQRVVELQEINRSLLSWKRESTKWKDRQAADGATRWDEWREWNEAQLDAIQSRAAAVNRAFEQDQRALRRMLDEHLEEMKKVLMLPVASIVEAFPKFVRDLGREHGKEVELVIRGMELEMDKRILEELKDPLIHLIRNCLDHGIERPEERMRKNKQSRGTIILSFSARDSRRAEILVSDDGAGIHLDQVRSAAIKTGIIPEETSEKLDSQESLSLIFRSGISTSPIITDISGRGLGLAIVREKVEKLEGLVSVESQTDVGTTFRIILPVTLATFRGVLVRVDEHLFLLPSINVERAVRVRQEEIRTIENRETIGLDGQILSIVRLGEALGFPMRNNRSSAAGDVAVAASDYIQVVVLESVNKHIAFEVDEVMGEHEVLVKELGRQLSRVRNIAGAAILGTGKVAPVLNVLDLMKSAARPAAVVGTAGDVVKTPAKAGKILVAEDSITARTLLKNILESAGYHVATAVDGVDAFTQLRSGEFDAIVSDVDMPRMSGFELTAKVRGDKKLGELPVVLVTALESAEDRERGIDVGADAYIVKSSFDQSNLLEVVRRLI
jgi:two-component system chemotaxis sensor kinase CheA